jgi:hypothetical protein
MMRLKTNVHKKLLHQNIVVPTETDALPRK